MDILDVLKTSLLDLHKELADHEIRLILGGGIDAGGAALAVALAAYQSSKTGKRVNIASVK